MTHITLYQLILVGRGCYTINVARKGYTTKGKKMETRNYTTRNEAIEREIIEVIGAGDVMLSQIKLSATTRTDTHSK